MKEKTDTKIFADLKVGESYNFPITRFDSVKVACCNYGIKHNKKFTTNINREAGIITVTRIA